MPPAAAVVSAVLVGSGTIAAATMGYIALGVTVAGMVTKNEKLLKFGSFLGLGTGVGALYNSFAGTAAGAASGAATSGGSAAKSLADTAATGGGMSGAEKIVMSGLPSQTAPAGSGLSSSVSGKLAGAANTALDVASTGKNAPVQQPTQGAVNQYSPENMMQADMPGQTQGAGLGAYQGANAGMVDVQTPADTGRKFGNFFDVFKDKQGNWDHRMIAETGKIGAGFVQGMSRADETNAILAERRRYQDLDRANLNKFVGSNYTLMRRPAQ